MGKATPKKTSNLGLVQPQQRSLRSRKREFPDDKIIQSSNNQTKPNPQDTETNSSTSVAQLPCLPQPAQQEATKLSTPQEQTEEQATDSLQEVIAPTSCLAASVCAEPVMDKAMKETDCEKSVLTRCIEAGVLENLKIIPLCDHNRDKPEESMEVQEHSRPSSTTPMDQHDDAEGCAPFCQTGQLEEENCGTETQSSKCSQLESDPACKADDKDLSNEPVVASKRRKRMGMCGLTEKERSHFLQTQKRDNGKEQRDAEEKRVEDRGYTGESHMELNEDKPCSHVDEETNVLITSVLNSPSAQSIPVGPFTKQSEVEKEPLPSIGEAVDRTEMEAHTLVTASEECSDAWNAINRAPVCSEVETADLTSPSEGCGQGPIIDIDVNRPTESAASKDDPEKPENLTEDAEDPFEEPHHSPSTVSATSALPNVLLIENNPDHQEGDQTSQQPMDSLARTAGLADTVETDTFGHGAQPCHSSIDPGLGGSENIGEEPSTDAAAPSGVDEDGNRGLYDDGTVSSPVATQRPLARLTPDLFEFTYISDSQLHNICLIEQGGLVEEEGGQVEEEGGLVEEEDATDLIHGLIRELSSLNRIVMATQRQVESLRRGNRGPKAY